MPQPIYRLDIAPLTPLPLTRSPFFSYRHPVSLPPGTLVQIPFGRRSLRGIVYDAKPLPGRAPLWLRPIERVIREGWLTQEQRSLALRISDLYFSSLGNTLKHFVVPLAQKAPFAPPIDQKKSTKPLLRLPSIKQIVCSHNTELIDTLIKLLRKSLAARKQTLLLVPDLLLLATLEQKLVSLFPGNIVTLSSKRTAKQIEQAWQRVRTNECPIVIGTRQALFAPFAKLEHIIILFPEERLSYKQWDMTPLYEATIVSRELAALFHSSLTSLTTSGGLTTLFPKPLSRSQTKKDHRPGERLPWRIIDQRQDGRGARSRLLAKPVEALLKQLPPTSRVLLVAKERGVSGVLLCQKCRLTARCPTCQHALAENKAGLLRCLNCRYESSLFPACSQCGHHHFKSFGIGTVKLEREIEKLFPAQTILRIDRDSLSTPAALREQSQAILADRIHWIITTPEIGSLLLLPKQDFIVMLEADHALAFPDFEGEEQLFLLLKRFQAKLAPLGQGVIQTFTPEERLWQFLAQGKETKLLTELLEEREHFGYPPVTAIIKIALLPQARESTKVTLEQIQKRSVLALQKEEGVTVTPIFQLPHHGGKNTPHFLIKYPATHRLPESLLFFLRRESAHLKIDVHPLHLH